MALRLPGHRARAASLALITTGASLGWLLPAAASAGRPVTASSAAAPTDDWPQIGYGPALTNDNMGERVIKPRNVASLKPAWTARGGAPLCNFTCAGSAAAVVHGVVYQSTAFGVFARVAATGRLLWRAPLGTSATIGTGHRLWCVFPAVGAGMVFAATGFLDRNGTGVAALSAATGKVLWTLPLDSQIIPPQWLSLAHGVLYVDSPYTLYAIVPATGHVLWSQHEQLAWAVAGGRAYVFTWQDHFAALDARTGKMLWRNPRRDVLGSSFGIVSRNVVYTAGGTSVYELDAATGRILRQLHLGCVPWSAAVAKGVVYVRCQLPQRHRPGFVSRNQAVEAVSTSTGRRLWRIVIRPTGRSANGDPILRGPIVANGVVYVEEFDPHAWRTVAEAIRAASGTMLWRYRLPDLHAECYLTVAEGKLFASLTTGMIAFAPR